MRGGATRAFTLSPEGGERSEPREGALRNWQGSPLTPPPSAATLSHKGDGHAAAGGELK
jgi:hypothetical protein